jgi:dipeptidyl aminopeptidase/acylaminoacyl peptidase
MTTDRLERALPDILLDMYLQSDVPYRNDLVGRTARTRQRPAWTFPGRWLPMADITRERVAAPGLPWRTIGVALLIMALLVGAIVVVGSRHTAVPPPFGVARTGLVAFSQDGDIFVADHLSGKTTAIVTGDAVDTDPRWSLDGTRIAFARVAADGAGAQAYAVGPDGRDLVLLTPEPLLRIDGYSFSPDGQSVLIDGSARVTMAGVDTTEQSMFLAAADGSGIHRIDVGMQALEPAFRPPNGEEIIFIGAPYMNAKTGIYAVRVDGTGLRTIIEPTVSNYQGGAYPSPDGTRIAYHQWRDHVDLTARTHIVRADGTGDVVLEPAGAWNAVFGWSNDGTRLTMIRGVDGSMVGAKMVTIPADGSGGAIELRFPGDVQPECCAAWAFAPDDTVILGTPTDKSGAPLAQVLWDPMTGEVKPAPWGASSPPSWQRLAP